MMKLPKDIQYVLDVITKHNHQAYVVGGCVRDSLLGLKPIDYDIATSASPDQIQSWFTHTIPTGLLHGTITVLLDEAIEVTTFRKESEYIDHRHPRSVIFVSSIEEDLSRRDFTINAMAYHPSIGLIDPFGGQKDLKKGIIRCVGDGQTRFEEDALRILRGHRFAARYHFQIEEKTMDAMKEKQELLSYISVERIRYEVVEIMKHNPYQLEQMTSLLRPWIPELEQCQTCSQETKYHGTSILRHTLHSIAQLKPFDETLGYALLFHDLAKPACKRSVKNQSHCKKGSEIAKRICREWKLTREQRVWIPRFVKYHDVSIKNPMAFIEFFCIEKQWPHEKIMDLFTIKRCDIWAHSTLEKKDIYDLEHLMEFYLQVKEERPLSLKDLPIDGKDIKALGYEGKDIKKALDACLTQGFRDIKMKKKEDYIMWLKGKEI